MAPLYPSVLALHASILLAIVGFSTSSITIYPPFFSITITALLSAIHYSVALILSAKSTPPRLAIFNLLPWTIPTILYALLITLLWGVIGGYWLTFSIIMFRPPAFFIVAAAASLLEFILFVSYLHQGIMARKHAFSVSVLPIAHSALDMKNEDLVSSDESDTDTLRGSSSDGYHDSLKKGSDYGDKKAIMIFQ